MNTRIDTALDLSAAFDRLLNDGNVEGLMDLMAEDAVSRTPQGAILTERAAIRANLSDMIGAGAVLHNKPRLMLEGGGVALLLIDWTLEIDSPSGRVGMSGTTANVARRETGGTWRLAVLNPTGTA